MSHETSTRERRFAETMSRVAAAMREFVVLVEQLQRDIDRLGTDMTTLAGAVDRHYDHLRMHEREVGNG